MTTPNPDLNALDLGGKLDARSLSVMSLVAGLWTDLLLFYETEGAHSEFRELLRSRNLGVFHNPYHGLYLSFTRGSVDRPAEEEIWGFVSYVAPPVHDIFRDGATTAEVTAWAISHDCVLGIERRLNNVDQVQNVDQVRDELLGQPSTVGLIRWEICQRIRKSRDAVTAHLATNVMAWVIDREAQRHANGA